MRKIIFTFLLLLFSFYSFSETPELIGMSKDSKCRITQSGGVTTESYTTNSGSTYELSASMPDSSKINYQLIIKNPIGNNYYNKSDFVTVYQGDLSRDIWSKINYTVDPITVQNPVTQEANKDEGFSTVEFCVVAGTVCLCSIALWDMCDTLTDGDTSGPIIHSHRHSGPTIWIDPYIDVSGSGNSSNNSISSSNNILYNQTSVSSSDYILAFHISSNNKYDYKVTVNTGYENLDYYFIRSDKKVIASKNTTSYSEATSETYNSFVVTAGIPEYTRLGGLYIYNGNPLGIYVGATIQDDTNGEIVSGIVTEHDFGNVVKTAAMPATSDQYYKFDNEGISGIKNQFTANIGLDVKLTDFMWLIGGCGIDCNQTYYYGPIYSSDDGTNYSLLTKGYIQDNYISFTPQFGLDFVFDHVNLGVLFSYSDTYGFMSNVMLGVAF